MPRPTKPARLELEAERRDASGRLTHRGGWLIVDKGKKRRTGCGPDDRAGAERALGAYLVEAHTEERKKPKRSLLAEDVSCADVLATYAERKTDTTGESLTRPVSRPKETLAAVERLLDYWGDMTLGDVDTSACMGFVKKRGTRAGARRDLEVFQAAINMSIRDGRCREVVRVSLPGKGKARDGYMTADQVTDLLRYCWRHQRKWRPPRGPNKGKLITIRVWPYRHLVPYILTALYTASRSARVWRASYEKLPGRPWFDLENGVFHRMWDGEVATKKRAERINIPPRLLGHLRRWRAGPLVDGERKPRRFLVEWNGKPANPRLALIRAMEAVFGKGHGLVLHSFRHTSVTWLAADGVPTAEIAQFASMTEAMVRQVYRHHHPESDKAVGKAFTSGKAGRAKKKATATVSGGNPGENA